MNNKILDDNSQSHEIIDKFNKEYPDDYNSYTIFEHFCSVPIINLHYKFNLFFKRNEHKDGDGRCDLIETDLTNKTVLDLGCFEGAHTYQFEKKNAIVTGIESNTHLFLKCLINKNTLNMKSKFLLGDITKYMTEYLKTGKKYDLVWCCGILYHLPNPIECLSLISKISKSFYIWTLYVTKNSEEIWNPINKMKMSFDNEQYFGYKYVYPNRYDREYAGANPYCIRISLDTIVKFCKKFGFSVKKLKCPNGNKESGRIDLFCEKNII